MLNQETDHRPTNPDKQSKAPIRRHLPKPKAVSSKPTILNKANNQNNKYLKLSKSKLSTNNSIFSSKHEMMGLAGINPPIGVSGGNVFVSKIQDPTFITPRYAVQNDIITDNIVMPNPHNVLKKYPSSYLKNKKVQIYKFNGNDPNKKLMTILNSLDTKVDNMHYIYEVLTEKEFIDDDQIAYDENFSLIDFDKIKQTIENDVYSVLGEAVFLCMPEVVAKYKEIINEDSYRILSNYPKNIHIFQDPKLGYFAINSKTLRRTKYFDEISKISIGGDIIND